MKLLINNVLIILKKVNRNLFFFKLSCFKNLTIYAKL